MSGIAALRRANGWFRCSTPICASCCAGPSARRLLDGWGELRKTWQIARSKRSWGTRQVYDLRSGIRVKVGVLAIQVTHPDHARPLWLVVARSKRGREPWYLVTSDPICTAEDAWTVVVAYARRWQIEQRWR